MAEAPAWTRLFPDADYAFHFGTRPGDAATFFRATADGDRLLAERRSLLASAPDRYLALLPEGDALAVEAREMAAAWRSLAPVGQGLEPAPGRDAVAALFELGLGWEPDFVLLRQEGGGPFIAVGGCVCFPSSWRLTDKIGHPLPAIHAPVPGLNDAFAGRIQQFLTRLQPGVAWLRSNWGLSASPELNQHLDCPPPPLTPDRELTEVYLRVENQALVRLPRSGGVLFGIRLEVIALDQAAGHAGMATAMARTLESMPAEVAAYKNLQAARGDLISRLRVVAGEDEKK